MDCRGRNPDDDLPVDFEASREVHYQALGKPRDPGALSVGLRERHAAALGRLNDGLAAGTTGGVKFTRPGTGSMHSAIRAGSPGMPRVVNRTYCYMITGGRPDRPDAAQRLSEKTLQSRRFCNRAGDRLFRSPGV